MWEKQEMGVRGTSTANYCLRTAGGWLPLPPEKKTSSQGLRQNKWNLLPVGRSGSTLPYATKLLICRVINHQVCVVALLWCIDVAYLQQIREVIAQLRPITLSCPPPLPVYHGGLTTRDYVVQGDQWGQGELNCNCVETWSPKRTKG